MLPLPSAPLTLIFSFSTSCHVAMVISSLSECGFLFSVCLPLVTLMLCSGMGTCFSESELGRRVKVGYFCFGGKYFSHWLYSDGYSEVCCCTVSVVLLIVCVVDRDGPCPELVRHRESKWLNLMTQWEQVMEKKSNKVCLSCCCILVCKIVYIKKGQRSSGTFKILTCGPHLYLGTRISFRHLFIF